MHVDTQIDAAYVIPVEPAGTILRDHSVTIVGGKIHQLLPTAEARFQAAEHFVLDHHALIPGLINLHTHAAMTLMRGLADDLPLMEWLTKHIWPAETKHISHEFVRDGTLLACAEMLRGGVTCFNDMYFFPEAAAEAAVRSGMRIACGIIVFDFPSNYAADPPSYLSQGFATRDEFAGETLVSFCLAPHAPYTVSDKTFELVAMYSQELDLPVHIHIHETEDEIRQSVERHGVRPLERLASLGLLGPSLIGVHAVHLNEHEIELMAKNGCHVAHCPSSNLKLASGIAPIAAMCDAGINVGAGTDSAASNNRLDMFTEMRTAALLAKASSGKADALPAPHALAMATINSAKALGLDTDIGSLAPGKFADIAAVDLSGPALNPCYDPISHIVYACGREDVSHVWVAGKAQLQERRFSALDVKELRHVANLWQNKLIPLSDD
ncbi:MAG: TRZ/ATZ family hydrolase [Burkholderiales bacterium]